MEALQAKIKSRFQALHADQDDDDDWEILFLSRHEFEIDFNLKIFLSRRLFVREISLINLTLINWVVIKIWNKYL